MFPIIIFNTKRNVTENCREIPGWCQKPLSTHSYASEKVPVFFRWCPKLCWILVRWRPGVFEAVRGEKKWMTPCPCVSSEAERVNIIICRLASCFSITWLLIPLLFILLGMKHIGCKPISSLYQNRQTALYKVQKDMVLSVRRGRTSLEYVKFFSSFW